MITISTGGLRLTTDFQNDNGQMLPGRAKAAIKNPCPVAVAPTGRGTTKTQIEVEPLGGGSRNYYGYNYLGNRIAKQGCSIVRGVIVEGFAGVEPGKPVFVSPDAYPGSPATTYSGLTQDAPAAAIARHTQLLGAAVSATGTFTIPAPGEAATLKSVRISVKTTVATDDANYWTFALANKGAAGTGTTVMLLATDANTTKATGGSAITSYVSRALSLTATAADLVTAAHDQLVLTATKASAAANLVDLTLVAEFELASGGSFRVGVGVDTTAIRFD